MLERYIVEIDYYYSFTGYDKNEDIEESQKLSYTIEALLKEKCCLHGISFKTSLSVLDDGTVDGLIIEEDRGKYILTLDKSVTIVNDEMMYDHRAEYSRATLTLIHTKGEPNGQTQGDGWSSI